ncbi:hypothetical protein SEA_CRACKLEWINK_69 [Mycobacterium phage Cracklewink]|uniref:Uncharacterized protein n=1 Tax=Mycobacterium phage Bipper TaxID=1805457 RepID=A0A142F2J8_9CAUD|nr:hypothetical protein KCH39_gp107 [Mycobacterium phage Bipper]AMQ67005.1 hypothetical protein SEA_BIPPER_70 [Mycobacterium phage Bipper]QDF19355.1 hypothetical protein SEA_CRACKLEWINK_69 [Mycobacterium phage Cracklewink]
MTDFSDLFPQASRNTAHYRGDVTKSLLAQTRPFGPDMHGAAYTCVSATYDAATDRTTATFRPIPPRQKDTNGDRPAQTATGPSRSQRRAAARRARRKGR